MIIILRDGGNITINEQETLYTSYDKEEAEVRVAYKDRIFVVHNVTGVRYVKDSPIDETDKGKVMEELEKAKNKFFYYCELARIYSTALDEIKEKNAGERKSIADIIELAHDRANILAKRYEDKIRR